MRPICLLAAALLACQAVWPLAGANAQDKGKDKGPPAAQKPTLTPGPGEQKKAVGVALKCATPEAVIRYTLDGGTPAADSGTVYAGPIGVDRTTTITAIAFAKDLAPSPPMVGTYLFGPREGLATFHIGNSLTNTTGKFADFVRTAGIVHQYRSFTAGGALTWQLWDLQMPKREKEWNGHLAAYKRIDHFTVQPRDFTKNSVDHEAQYAIRFFEVVRKHSPEMQPWFYAEWVEKNRGRPTDQGKMASAQMKQTYPAQTWEESMAAMLLYNEDLQTKVVETYKEGKRPRVLPSCIAMGWIKNMIDHGKLPGAEKGSMYPFLFSNDSVHPNVKGGYLVDMTWYAAFYRASPEGKVLPAGAGLTAEQARVMQKLAWDVVKNYPDCGLFEEGTTPVAAPEFVSEPGPAGKTQALTLRSKTPGAWFRYTLDGTIPTRTRGYVYCGVVNVPAGATLKAIAYKSGMADSAVAEMPMVGTGFGPETSIIAPGAKLEKLAGDFKFTEGPAADAQGNVFFTDQPNDRILKWSVDGKLSTFMEPCGRSNGLCFDAKGNLLACADDKNELWSIAPDKKITVLVKDYQGKLLNGPNDVWIRPDQGIYFTDPFYKRPYWKRGPKELDVEGVYYLPPGRQKLTRVIDDLKQPNGIIGTPDGKILYVADIGAGRTYAYDIQSDGTLAGKRLFCKLGSDGMTIDNEGNVYLTGRGVTVFDRTGKEIQKISVPESWTANVCFGGKDRQTLFITAMGNLYGIRMCVKGVGSQ